MVFQSSLLDWRRGGVSLPWVYVHSLIYENYVVYWFSRDLCSIGGGGGSVCNWYMCILLYVKVIWCSGFPEIYARLEEGVGSVCHEYMCILLYVKLIWCCSFPEIYAQLEEEGGSVLHGYICILLYVKFIWCSSFPEFSAWLEERVGSVLHGYMCILLYLKLILCCSFPEIYAQLEEGGWDQSCMGICTFFYMWKLFGVVVFQRSMLN